MLTCYLFIAVLTTACSDDSYSTNAIKIFEVKSHFECGEHYFYLDGKYSSIFGDLSSLYRVEGDFIELSPLETNQLSNIQAYYVSTEIWHYHQSYQNIFGATSAIMNDQWIYQLEFPSGEKGTYEFEPSDEEMEIFKHLVYRIISNQPQSVQIFNTEYGYLSDPWPPPVIYLELREEEKVREYFSTLSTGPCEFDMLFEFVATVLRLNKEASVPSLEMEKLKEVKKTLSEVMSEYK